MLELSIIQQLIDTSGVTDLVGSEGVYLAGEVPQSAEMPYVVVHRVFNEPWRHQTGGCGKANVRLQVDCVATDKAQSHDVYEQVRQAIDNFSGTMGSGDYTTQVDSCVTIDDGDEEIEPTEGSQTGHATRRMDFAVWYYRTAVTNQ